jgi:NADH:ubiquinone oxidoreductase subunit 4 (subunit M)
MTDNKNMMHKLAALLMAFIGVAAMVSAWFILLTTASHNVRIVALEIFGVVVTTAGYFLWRYSNRSKIPAIKEEQNTEEEMENIES